MTPERMQQIEELFHLALQVEPKRRYQFLEEACAGDEPMRLELVSLLEAHERPGSFIDQAIVEGTQARWSTFRAAESHENGADELGFRPRTSDVSSLPSLLNGRYMIERELGRGGIGIVYLAKDRQLLSKPCVVKVLLEDFCEDAWFQKKFQQEIEALSRVDHPGVVGILDAGITPNGKHFLVMQYIRGVDLRSLIQREGMEFKLVAEIVRQIGFALTAAHANGVIHCDLKPENIMLQNPGEDRPHVKILDFGIAKIKDSQVKSSSDSTRVAGTARYMAPEQIDGTPSAASDTYALGVIAYEMVTGRCPFNPTSHYKLLETVKAGLKVKPSSLRPDLPKAAQEVILRALSLNPCARHSRSLDFGEELARALTAPSQASSSDRTRSSTVREVSTVGGESLSISPFLLLLTSLLLASGLGVAVLIARRFLSPSPDIMSVGVILSLILLFCVAGSTFTKNGQQRAGRALARVGINVRYRGTFGMAGALAALIIVCAFYISLPSIARIYNNSGAKNAQRRSDLAAAIKSYERAVSLDPAYSVAHYNLGSAYEDVLELDKALVEYQTALRDDPTLYFAYNNLARLYLLHRKDFAAALKILNSAIELNPAEPEINYTLYKNRGWAHFRLELYEQAIGDLTQALKWREDGAAAYCLLAQVREAQGKTDTAIEEWENCVAYSPGDPGVEASWVSIAQEKLRREK